MYNPSRQRAGDFTNKKALHFNSNVFLYINKFPVIFFIQQNAEIVQSMPLACPRHDATYYLRF